MPFLRPARQGGSRDKRTTASVESLRGHCWIEGVPSMRRSDTTLPGISRIPVSIRAPARGAILVAAVLVASGLLWAVMFFGSLAHLTRLAGGLTPFDIRPWGYS